MKKLGCLILSTFFCISACFSVVFASTAASSDVYSDENIEIVIEGDLYTIFQPAIATKSTSAVNRVDYSYTFDQLEGQPNKANVTLDFVLTIGTTEYPITVSGIVNSYNISSDCTLWEGPLQGIIAVNGISYNVLVSFLKLSSEVSIQAGVTIQSADIENQTDPVAFQFGENILTQNMYLQIMEQQVDTEQEQVISENTISPLAQEDYSYLTSTYSWFDSSINGYSQKATAYSSNTQKVAVAVKSFTDNVNDSYTNSGQAGTTVSSFGIELERVSTSTTNNSWIVGTESFDFNTDNYNSSAVVAIKPLFEDIMSILEIPTSTINAMLNSLNGSVDRDVNTNKTSVNVSFGWLDGTANFDDSDIGVPIVFQLDRDPGEYIGPSTYRFTTSITYCTLYTPQYTSNMSIFYNEGLNAASNIYIYL